MQALKPTTTTILLIATSEQRRHVVAQQLEALGYSVIVVTDTTRLQHALQTHQFDLLVLDTSEGDGQQQQQLVQQATELLDHGTPLLMLKSNQLLDPTAWTQETLGYRVAAALRSRHNSDVLAERATRWADLNVLDPASFLFSRRYFDATFSLEVERMRRMHQPLTILMIDLPPDLLSDDRHWPSISVPLLSSLRQTDVVVRFEPFTVAILLPGTDAAVARAVSARLIKTLHMVSLDDYQPLQVSAGFATYPQHGTTPEALLSAAQYARRHAIEPGMLVGFDQL